MNEIAGSEPAEETIGPMRVLMLLTNTYDPDPRVRQEALALIRLGYRVRIMAWDRDAKDPPHQVMEGVEVERVFLASTHGRGTLQLFFYALLYLRMLWRGLRTPFDVVHCHDLDTLPLGFILGKLKRRPIVYDAHESFTDMLEGSVNPAVRRRLASLENFFIRRIDLLITVGEKLRKHFESRGSKHSVVVGNWKKLEEFARSDAQNRATRQVLGVPDDALLVACVTQLLKDRKIEELVEAVNRTPNVWLIIAGKGVLKDYVRNAAAANTRILFVDFLTSEKIAEYTCASDVIYYGFDPANPNARFSAPNKLFEAVSAGRPLVTGDFGEIAEVVRERNCGIVLPKYGAEEICAAFATLADPEARAGMAARALDFGRNVANWARGEATLKREYAALTQDRAAASTPALEGGR